MHWTQDVNQENKNHNSKNFEEFQELFKNIEKKLLERIEEKFLKIEYILIQIIK